MGSLDNWNGECLYNKGEVCIHQTLMYTSSWMCTRDCVKCREGCKQ